jgi:hypothetical protein
MTVYALRDPRTGAARYVGCTCALTRRLQEHIWRAAHDVPGSMPAGLRAWLTELAHEGSKPDVERLEETESWEGEARWICTLRAVGEPLLNECDGGRGIPGYTHRPESVVKFAAALRGCPKSAAHRLAMAAAARHRQYSPRALVHLRRHAARIRPLIRPRPGELNGQARLTAESVATIRALYAAGETTYRALASRFGVSPAAIRFVVTRRTWRTT